MRPRLAVGFALGASVALGPALSSCSPATGQGDSRTESHIASISSSTSSTMVERYRVVSVADGDTVTVSIDGAKERVRLIGIDAPELSNPPECFGRESADRAIELLSGTDVQLIADQTQEDRDRYGRLLRYVVLPDGTLINGEMVRDGLGVWSASCRQPAIPNGTAAASTAAPGAGSTQLVPDPNCPIKGNVNSKGDRIYHVPGDASYDGTVITPAKGERWFCSEAEAAAAGWRAAKN